LESERRNEFNRIACHHDENVVTLFDEQTGELGGFVGSDGARDTEHDAFRASDCGFCWLGTHRSWLGQGQTSA
jgi:hypothetical protein